jgi:hypothetical protein
MQLPIELSHPCYHDDEAARIQLESIRWPDGPFCPICGAFDTVKPMATPPKAKGGGWHWCGKCSAPVHRPRRLDIPPQPYPDPQMASRLSPNGGIKEGFLGASDAPDPQG